MSAGTAVALVAVAVNLGCAAVALWLSRECRRREREAREAAERSEYEAAWFRRFNMSSGRIWTAGAPAKDTYVAPGGQA